MARLVDQIATSLESAMRVTFLQAVQAAVNYVSLAELETALRRKDTALVQSLLERAVAERFLPELKPFYDILTAAMTAAGSAPVIGASMQFSLTDARVRSWISQHAGILVTGIANQTVQAIRRVVQAGYTEGFAPRVQARLIRDVIGLTPRQAVARENYAASLRDLGVPPERQVELTALYTHRLKTQRATSIARQETFSATMAGRYELWSEQFARGALQAHRTWLKWIVVDDDRLCPYCRPMDGKTVRFGTEFTPVEKGGVGPTYRTRKPDPFSQKRDLQGRFAKAAGDGIDMRPLTDAEKRRLQPVKHPPLHIQCRCDLVLVFEK